MQLYASIYVSKHKHSLVFTALSERDKCISEHEHSEWIKNLIASAKIFLCHCLPVFWRALCDGVANWNNQCFLPRGHRRKQQTVEQCVAE